MISQGNLAMTGGMTRLDDGAGVARGLGAGMPSLTSAWPGGCSAGGEKGVGEAEGVEWVSGNHWELQ